MKSVSFPQPELGLVVRYAYLWAAEQDQGRDEGIKDRPCAIVLNIMASDGGIRVTVLPITHSPPIKAAHALEIPSVVKDRLGLDMNRSWVVLSEGNEFTWPGPDLRPQPGQGLSAVAYGLLPPQFFNEILKRFIELAKAGIRARATH